MTRTHWIFVLALVVAFSYGLVQSEQSTVARERTPAGESGHVVSAQALPTDTPVAVTVTLRPTFTPLPTLAPTETAAPTAAPTATPQQATAADGVADDEDAAQREAVAAAPAAAEPPVSAGESDVPAPPPAAETGPNGFDTHPEEPRFIYIDQSTQMLYIYEYGELLREIPCSTGLPESDKYTPAASGRVGEYWPTFTSFGVEADDAWYLFRSSGNILIHSLPYLRDEQGNKLYQDAEMLGVRPSSHGCIRIAPEDARWLTAYNPNGALFEVTEPYLSKWLALD